jgi:hypothetical protein
MLKVANGKNKSILKIVKKEKNCTNFPVTPQTAKVMATAHISA